MAIARTKRDLSTLVQQRLLIVSIMVVLGIIIAVGSIYVQRNPALSSRALYAMIQYPFFVYQFSSIVPERSSGAARSIPVLTYHRIVSDSSDVTNVNTSNFKDQMRTLKSAGWEAITLQEFEELFDGKRQLPEKSFLLTFDDAAKESFYPVDPIIHALGYHAVNFIIVNSSNIERTTYYLTPREIKRMLTSGRWSIGSHSFDGHRPYPTDADGHTGIFFADRIWNALKDRLETPEEFTTRVRDDLLKAKSELEATYTVPIKSFAFPLGNEAGIEGANNFPEGAAITEGEARKIYDFGFKQTNNQQFTANFPHTENATSTPQPSDDFLMYRIHVDYDWDGKRVLEIMENGLPKNLPLEDDFATNKGWIPAWGSLELGRNNFVLDAPENSSSASSFLDGTALWDDYSFDAAVTWQNGHVIILGDVIRSDTYHSCVFSPGVVRIQSTIKGETRTLAEMRDTRIAFGEARAGIRVHDDVIECRWNFESVVENYSRDFSGGIGLQTWDPAAGNAHLQVSSIIVRPFATTTP